VIAFTVYGQAAPAGSKRGFQRGGRVIITDANPNARAWKAVVLDAASQAMNGHELLHGPISLQLTFCVPRPKGHYGSGRNADRVRGSAPAHPTVKPDLLKLARGVEDALSGVCYRDDAQIVREVLRKEYSEPARVEVVLTETAQA
jgi:Holliday junction resolvase RusA-like endonuclease